MRSNRPGFEGPATHGSTPTGCPCRASYPPAAGYWVSREPVEPLECVALGDLLVRHVEAGIELRIVPELRPLWDRVIASTLEFSGIRLRNL